MAMNASVSAIQDMEKTLADTVRNLDASFSDQRSALFVFGTTQERLRKPYCAEKYGA